MIIDMMPNKIGSFQKCCTCGHVVDSISRPDNILYRHIPSQCSCDKKVLAYYPECPGCHGFTSHCTFCTNSAYGDLECRYVNKYISKHESRRWIGSFLHKMKFEGLLSEEVLTKALNILE